MLIYQISQEKIHKLVLVRLHLQDPSHCDLGIKDTILHLLIILLIKNFRDD